MGVSGWWPRFNLGLRLEPEAAAEVRDQRVRFQPCPVVRGPDLAWTTAQNLIRMETQAQFGVKVRTQNEVGSEGRGQRSAFLFPRNELDW